MKKTEVLKKCTQAKNVDTEFEKRKRHVKKKKNVSKLTLSLFSLTFSDGWDKT